MNSAFRPQRTKGNRQRRVVGGQKVLSELRRRNSDLLPLLVKPSSKTKQEENLDCNDTTRRVWWKKKTPNTAWKPWETTCHSNGEKLPGACWECFSSTRQKLWHRKGVLGSCVLDSMFSIAEATPGVWVTTSRQAASPRSSASSLAIRFCAWLEPWRWSTRVRAAMLSALTSSRMRSSSANGSSTCMKPFIRLRPFRRLLARRH